MSTLPETPLTVYTRCYVIYGNTLNSWIIKQKAFKLYFDFHHTLKTCASTLTGHNAYNKQPFVAHFSFLTDDT